MRSRAWAWLLLGVVASACQPKPLEWSCAAVCLMEAHCRAGGDSSWRTRIVTTKGTTAAHAYAALYEQCPTNDGASLGAGARCNGGELEIAPAPLSLVCAR